MTAPTTPSAAAEAMARAIEPDSWTIATQIEYPNLSPYGLETLRLHAETRQAKAMSRAQAALTALITLHPGIAEVIAGRAVVVPVEFAEWQDMASAPKGKMVWLRWGPDVDVCHGEAFWREGIGWVAAATFHKERVPHPRFEFREFVVTGPTGWRSLDPTSPYARPAPAGEPA